VPRRHRRRPPVLAAYDPLFSTARARRLVAASLLGRLAVGMFDLALILLAQDATGSYAVAGAAVGAFGAGVAVSAPFRGRLVDRRGVRSALPPFVVVNAAMIAALPAAAETGAGWLIVLLAGASGLSVPPLAACMRIEWQRLLGQGHARLDQAYAFEAAAQVSLFIVGPLIAGAGVAIVGPGATLAVTAAVALVGGAAFTFQASDTPSGTGAERGGLGPIRLPGMRTLVLATAFADTGLGAIDVTVTAFAQQRGEAGAAGALLALFAASSVVGGSLYGARSWSSPPARRLALLVSCAAVTMIPLALADSLLALALLLVIAGLPSTAQWATSSLALDRVAPPANAAEAYTWLSTANAAGVGAGGILAGAAIELSGTSAAFVVAAAGVALGAVILVARRHTVSERLPGASGGVRSET
jgi:MFS family permease